MILVAINQLLISFFFFFDIKIKNKPVYTICYDNIVDYQVYVSKIKKKLSHIIIY